MDIIRQHADNNDKKSLLQRCTSGSLSDTHKWNWKRIIDRAWTLKPLTGITGVQEITVSFSHAAGEPSWRWFGQCLVLRMRGEGGELKEVNRSVRVIKRWENTGATRTSERLKNAGGKKEEVVVTKKKTDDPTFDRVEFA